MKKQHISSDAVAFQSDALEIASRRLPWWGRVGLLWAALFFAGVVVWACVSEVDVIVTATGKVVTDHDIVLKPYERSVIKEINVKVGDFVKKDQVLITFDTTISQAEAQRFGSQLESLRAEFNRVRAEFTGQPYRATDPESIAERYQEAIYRQRQSSYRAKIDYYEENIKRIEAAQKSQKENFEKQYESLQVLGDIIGIYKQVEEGGGSVTRREMLEWKFKQLQVEGDVANLRNSLTELEHEYQSAVAQRESFIEEWNQTISEQLVTTERDMSNIEKQYEKAQRLATYDLLRSPADATVLEIASFSANSAVREAEALITLVPVTEKPELEVELQPRDIGKVEVGSTARIKLNAYPFQKYGTLEGRIRTISDNTLEQAGSKGEAKTFYRARLEVSGRLEYVPENFHLRPGMEAQVDMRVGKRRIIEYILHPLIKALDQSAREP